MGFVDIYGREIEKGDEVVFLDVKNHAFIVTDAGNIAMGSGMRLVKMATEIVMPIADPRIGGLPVYITKKAEKKSLGSA